MSDLNTDDVPIDGARVDVAPQSVPGPALGVNLDAEPGRLDAPSHRGGHRRPPKAGGLRTWWHAWRRPIAVASGGTVMLRVIAELIALVSAYGTSFPHLVARRPALLVDVFDRWDAGYYLSIAQHGYAGRHPTAGQSPNAVAFAPLYPLGVRAVHLVSGAGWVLSAALVSTVALWAGLVGLHQLVTLDRGAAAGTTVTLLLAFPTAFFFVAPYPEGLALATLVWAFYAARRNWWLAAGLFAAGAALTKYYLVLVVLPLALEAWMARPTGVRPPRGWRGDAVRLLAVGAPAAAALAATLVYQQVHVGSAIAFVHAQSRGWHRHFAFPWTLLSHTVSDMVHLRFLDTSTASVVELFDFVTVLTLAVVAVGVFLRVRRSYGLLLGLAWCVFCFQNVLLSETREVLALFPFFIGLGWWIAGHPWRERALLVLFLPASYFLLERFVQGRFAG